THTYAVHTCSHKHTHTHTHTHMQYTQSHTHREGGGCLYCAGPVPREEDFPKKLADRGGEREGKQGWESGGMRRKEDAVRGTENKWRGGEEAVGFGASAGALHTVGTSL